MCYSLSSVWGHLVHVAKFPMLKKIFKRLLLPQLFEIQFQLNLSMEGIAMEWQKL